VLAQQTRTIHLGSGVSSVSFRPPALLARQAADVDRLSGGRLHLGLGVGDIPAEFAAFGIPYPPARARQRALEEAVELVRGLWGPEPFTYQGHYYAVDRGQVPPPVQEPDVPLLIGGGGERVTLRLVAQYADMTNFGPHPFTSSVISVADVQHKLAVLRRHCAAVGRPFATILRSLIVLPLVLASTSANSR
jgi:alkanesulfonate monooxygenase SsuD/methylene tetrahydromethanopterin reductase-like flavin-dependent oxidoreductase (luciferase family)